MKKGLLVGTLFGIVTVVCIMFAVLGTTHWDLKGFFAALLGVPAIVFMAAMGYYLLLNQSVTLPQIKGVGYAFTGVVALGLIVWGFSGLPYVSPDTPNPWLLVATFIFIFFFFLPYAGAFRFRSQRK